MDLGKRLQECREARGFTQQEMADACGLSKNHISAIERGVHQCSAQTLITYADKLSMSIDELVGRGYAGYIIPDLCFILEGTSPDQQRKILQMIQLMIQ